MRPTYLDSKEDTMAMLERLESSFTNLTMQIEFSEEISEQEYRNIEKSIDKVNADIRELKDQIYFSK